MSDASERNRNATPVTRQHERESVTGSHGHGGVDDIETGTEMAPRGNRTRAAQPGGPAGSGGDELLELDMAGEDQFPQRLEKGGALGSQGSSGPDAGQNDVSSHRDGADAEAIRLDDPARRRLSPTDDIDLREPEAHHDGR
jgi:hypothetical protein